MPAFFRMYYSKYLTISLINPKRTLNKLKRVFKPLKLRFYFGKQGYHITDWCNVTPFMLVSSDVGWKDKYATPRFEHCPYFWIRVFKWNFIWYWCWDNLDTWHDDNQYWEQALWYLYYYKNTSQGHLEEPTLNKARESWPWIDCRTNKTTWDTKYEI